MTSDETRREMRELARAEQALERKIVEAARAILPVLLDAGRTHSAKTLQELFFEYDAKQQEMLDFIKRDPVAAMDAIMRDMPH